LEHKIGQSAIVSPSEIARVKRWRSTAPTASSNRADQLSDYFGNSFCPLMVKLAFEPAGIGNPAREIG